ncbi:MAG TPA: multidrug effflux MFS transporter [Coxiellaceae bacterium]|nr:multidrug effflux MFS transporter [Coxiellaceae bacterium]
MKKAIEGAFRLKGKEPNIFSLMLLSAFASMGAILMTPALPQIAAYFKTTIGVAQLTVTSFLLGYALGQLIYGPLANRLGRKPSFMIGIAVATLGSIFSILSSPTESFHLLILGRLLEALGSSVGLVVCFTIINDFYFPKDARRITGILMIAFAIVPGVAVAAGGGLTEYMGWQACFYFLLAYGFVLIIPAVTLPETVITLDKNALESHYLFINYTKMLCNKKFVGYALCGGFSASCIYVFGAEGPYIGIRLLGISPAKYGLLGLIPFIGTLIGALMTLQFSDKNPRTVLKMSFLIQFLSIFIMLISFVSHHVSLLTLLAPMVLFCVGYPILMSTALSLAMAETEDKANGSAVMNFMAVSMPVIMTFLLGVFHIEQAWFLPLMLLLALFLSAFCYLFFVVSVPCAEKL